MSSSKIPKLRFREFSSDWHVTKLGNLLKIGSGRDYKHLSKGNIPVYGTGGLMLYVNDYLYDGKSVCIGRKGTINKPQLLNGKFWTVDTLFYTYDYKNFLPDFLYLIFQKINWKQWNEASGVPSLSKTTIEKIKVNVPYENEQKKIADFLTQVDNRINLQQEKLNLLKKYKQGLMQQIFSQKLRFKDEDGKNYPAWQEKSIRDIAYSETSPLAANTIVGKSGDYKVYGASGILQKLDTYHYEDEFIAIVKDGAGVGRIMFCEPKSSILGTLIVIQPKDKIDKKFLLYLLSRIDFKKYITGSTIPHIYFNQYSAAKFNIPTYEEQQKIANFLTAIDDKINLEKSKLAEANIFKKTLLQQMFI